MATSQVTGRPSRFAARTSATPSARRQPRRCARARRFRATSARIVVERDRLGRRRESRPGRAASRPRRRARRRRARDTRPAAAARRDSRTSPRTAARGSSTCVSASGASACENATQPASASSPISVSVVALEPDGQRADRIDVRLIERCARGASASRPGRARRAADRCRAGRRGWSRRRRPPRPSPIRASPCIRSPARAGAPTRSIRPGHDDAARRRR